jgi:hypothetical protein
MDEGWRQRIVDRFSGGLVSTHSDPEWAEAQNVQNLVENHPRAAIISGSVGLAIPFVAAGAFALPELLGAGAIAEGPAATLELAQEIANVESYLMRFRRTISLLETAEGPTLVAGGGTDLSAAQIAMARQLGLTPVQAWASTPS